MFAIATPQTVELLSPKYVDPASPEATQGKAPPPPESHGTATFSHPHEDVSQCQLVIASKDKIWTFLFNVNGVVTSTDYIDDEIRKAREAAAKKAEEAKKKLEADAKAAREKELKTSADTTARDVSSDAEVSRGGLEQMPPMKEPA